jgi:hypothetical protein
MIGGTDGQLLAIYHAEPGTSNADKLTLLASLAGVPQAGSSLSGPDQAGEVSSDSQSRR